MSELCYINNPNSLFRKYAKLITSLTKHQLFRDYLGLPNKKIALLLPNGFHEIDSEQGKLIVYSRAIYSPKLTPALQKLDLVQPWLKSFKEAEKIIAWSLGLIGGFPSKTLQSIMFAVNTFNPDAHEENTSVDGYAARQSGVDEVWNSIRGGAGDTSSDTDANLYTFISASTTSNQWDRFYRCAFLYDTSSLPDGITVDSALHRAYVTAKTPDDFNQGIEIVNSNLVSNTALENADYQNIGTTQQATALDITGLNTSAYNDWTLNSTGIGNISLSGITKFGSRTTGDRSNTEPTWASADEGRATAQSADGANAPKLEVTYNIPSGFFAIL